MVAQINLTEDDVVRHRLVKMIIRAYDKESQYEEERDEARVKNREPKNESGITEKK